MSAAFTVLCPHCGTTTTVRTGVAKNGAGVGPCRICHKNIRIYVDDKGDVIKVV